MRQIEFTWWAEDSSECRGRVSLAPNASPDTAAALARMMRLDNPAESGARRMVKAPFRLEDSRDELDGPQEERY